MRKEIIVPIVSRFGNMTSTYEWLHSNENNKLYNHGIFIMTAGTTFILGFISYTYPIFLSIEVLFWITGGLMLLFSLFYVWTFNKKRHHH